MARKTLEDSEKTRQLLIEKAGDMFYENGVSATTLQDVAEAAGMSRGAIYWRFQNKAELFQAFIEDSLASTERAIESLLENDSLNPLEKLRALMVTVLQIPAKKPRVRQAFAVMAHRCEYTREFRAEQPALERLDREYIETLESLIREAQDTGLITGDQSCGSIAFAVSSYIEGIINRWTYEEDGFGINLEKEGEVLVDLFLQGIKSDFQ